MTLETACPDHCLIADRCKVFPLISVWYLSVTRRNKLKIKSTLFQKKIIIATKFKSAGRQLMRRTDGLCKDLLWYFVLNPESTASGRPSYAKNNQLVTRWYSHKFCLNCRFLVWSNGQLPSKCYSEPFVEDLTWWRCDLILKANYTSRSLEMIPLNSIHIKLCCAL